MNTLEKDLQESSIDEGLEWVETHQDRFNTYFKLAHNKASNQLAHQDKVLAASAEAYSRGYWGAHHHSGSTFAFHKD